MSDLSPSESQALLGLLDVSDLIQLSDVLGGSTDVTGHLNSGVILHQVAGSNPAEDGPQPAPDALSCRLLEQARGPPGHLGRVNQVLGVLLELPLLLGHELSVGALELLQVLL